MEAGNAFNLYLRNDVVPADVLRELEMWAPVLHVNRMINGVGRREIERLLCLIPAKSILIEVDDSWDEQDETLAGLMAGHYIETIFIKGCSQEIKALPQSTRKVSVRADDNCAPLRSIIGNENIKEMALIGGRVDLHTLVKLSERMTMMNKLEFIGCEIENIQYGEGCLKRVREFVTREVTVNGKRLNHREIVEKIRK